MGSREPISRLYFGILPTVLSMVNFPTFAQVLLTFSTNLDVSRHGGRHQDARLIGDFDREHEQAPPAANHARCGGHAARRERPQVMNRKIRSGYSFVCFDLR